MSSTTVADSPRSVPDSTMQGQSTFAFLLRAAGPRTVTALVATALLVSMLDLAGIAAIFPYLYVATHPERLSKYIADDWAATLSPGGDTNGLLIALTGALLLIYILKALIQAFLARYQFRALARFTANLTNDTVERLLDARYEVFQRTAPSELAGIAYANTVHATIAVQSMVQILSEGVFIVVLVGAFLIVQPVVALISIAVFGVTGMLLYVVVVRRISAYGESQSRTEALRHRLLYSIASAIRDIRIMGLGPLFAARNHEISALYTDAAWRYNFMNSIPRLAIELTVMLILVSAAGVFLALRLPLDQIAPMLGVAAVGAMRTLPGLSRLIAAINNLRFYRAFVGRLIAVRKELGAARVARVEDGLTFAKEISLSRVGFRYGDQWVLRKVDLTIRRGESIGIVGSSGAGKTTVLDLFTGLQRTSEGSFSCDGKTFDPFLSLSMTRLIGYVPQVITLLDASIAYNIAFDRNPDPARLASAIRIANLEAFVDTLPEGTGTQVGENGVRLSGGQRQRIGIARALYRNPAILVLDEATSALDTVTERELSDEISKLHGDITMLIATHRLATVRRCDRIYVMDAGHVVDSGTHDDLTVRCSVYRRLVEAHDGAPCADATFQPNLAGREA